MNRRLPVLIIGPTPPPFHGVAVAVQTLLQSTIVKEFEVRHLELADRRGIQHVNKPDLHDVFLFCGQWARLVGMLFHSRPRLTYLVLSQSTIGFLRDSLLLWPAALCGSTLILHLHGGNFGEWFSRRSWIMKAHVRTMLRRATRVIVLGESLKKLFDGLVKESHIFVVPNGIEWKRPEQPVEKTGNTALYRILHLSTLSHLKGALVLLQAIPLILCRHQNVQFVFAGPWSHLEDKQWAEEFIRREGIACFVEFTGQVEDGHKRKLFESSHMFIFPGLQQEGQPLVVLEAMAASLPILFTDRGCLKETVEDGTSGLCVRTNDPQDLANHIVSMLEHPQRMYEMGRAARKRYEERFTKEQHIAAMLQVFQSAIAAVK